MASRTWRDDTPASFQLLPGAADSPVILHVPHSSSVIPESVRDGIVLDDRALELELDHITDSHTAEIAAAAVEAGPGTPWRFVNGLSRLVIDPERYRQSSSRASWRRTAVPESSRRTADSPRRSRRRRRAPRRTARPLWSGTRS
jgi:hypothetical protein